MSDNSNQIPILVSILSFIVASLSLFWSYHIYKQAAKGYMRPSLECELVKDGAQRYISCRMSVENTGKTDIVIDYCFIIICNLSMETNINKATKRICEMASKESSLNNLNKLLDPRVINYLESNFGSKMLTESDFVLKSLPYYYKRNLLLGSFENLATTITFPEPPGLYSVDFFVLGDRRKPSSSRSGHFEILVPGD